MILPVSITPYSRKTIMKTLRVNEYIACETTERESKLFLFRNIRRVDDDLSATSSQFENKNFMLID